MNMLNKRVKIVSNDSPCLNRFKKGDVGLVIRIDEYARGGWDHTVQLDSRVNPIVFQAQELRVTEDV